MGMDAGITSNYHNHNHNTAELKDQIGRQRRQAALLKRSHELNQIWECMRLASQELMDACSRADLVGVLKVLDATLVHPRLSLEETEALEAATRVAEENKGGDNDDLSRETNANGAGEGKDRHGKRRQSNYDPVQSRHDSIGTGSEAKFLDEDLIPTSMMMEFGVNADVGTSTPHRASATAAVPPTRDQTLGIYEEVPMVIHRSSLFRPRSRVNSDGGYTTIITTTDDNLVSPVVRSGSETLSNPSSVDPESDSPPHMPWVDGRALTSALLAVCFRRDGYASPEAELEEERRAVPIVKELLKYDCMLTAQSLGQAVLGVAYSRSAGSLKRAREQRLLWRRQKLQPQKRREDRNVGGASTHSRQDSFSLTAVSGVGSSTVEPLSSTTTGTRVSNALSQESDNNNDRGMETVMDLLLERIGPREWLKLIKCYLQRQEFDDLAVVLERCPFKGPQLETRNKEQDKSQQHPYYSSVIGTNTTPGRRGTADSVLSPHQAEYDRQRAREMICREAGICGVGPRIGHFNGRGAGQATYNVASTLYDSSHILFTGSGTRFSHSYMLPRGGFRGIGGNSSGHNGSPSNSSVSQVVGSAESVHAMDEEEAHEDDFNTSGAGISENQTPPNSNCQQHQTSSQINTSDQHRHQQPYHDFGDNTENIRPTNDNEISDEESDGPFDDEDDDDPDVNLFEASHDSNFAFGGVGSSTTSSSRPGPGIVGIAIQVQAPEHILRALLKMGFRFFSICDLSVPDNRHPLALQFRQQEKMNRQLIEFCMVPNIERLGDGLNSVNELGGREKGKGRKEMWKKFNKRDEARYDEADREAHALVVQAFLYPTVNSSTRTWSSIPALPTMVSSISQRIGTVSGTGNDSGGGGRGGSGGHSPSPISPTTLTNTVVPSAAQSSSTHAASSSQPTTGVSTLTPSNRLQFVLPPMQLGDSFESISTIIKFADNSPDHPTTSISTSTTPINNNNNNNDDNDSSQYQSTLPQVRYRQSGLATSMPLPIRTSMIEKRLSTNSTFFAFYNNNTSLSRSPSSTTSLSSAAAHFANQQTLLYECIRRRVRETLRSDFMDLMTVGICLYQACYHAKEVLLTVLLEHRLLIAQDALTGAVQVAASVGWKRGLELLLCECSDMEAEIEPVVTTTSEYVHLGTSMKWDHATAAQVSPSGDGKRGKRSLGTNERAGKPIGSLGALRGARVAAAGGLEGLVTRGLRRHRSDGGRLSRFSDTDEGGGYYFNSPTVEIENNERIVNRRASFDLSQSPVFPSDIYSTSPISESLITQSLITEPVIPTARSSSLRSRLSSLIPNLGVTVSPTDLPQKPKIKHHSLPHHLPSNQIDQKSSNVPSSSSPYRPDPPPAIVMLSTSGLWSIPSVMMQRKSRNAVVALMAACTRNDPSLVTWLIETFADIKVVHIMQALMIACDRGLVRVVKALIGSPLDTTHVGERGNAYGKKKVSPSGKNKKEVSSRSSSISASRSLFRRWLTLQYQQIIDLTKPSFTASNPTAGSGVAVHEDEDQPKPKRADPDNVNQGLSRYSSFPFLFLMESSPLFRHYYQTLNTLSSCQFMLKHTVSLSANSGSGNDVHRASVAPSTHLNPPDTQQQQQSLNGAESSHTPTVIANTNIPLGANVTSSTSTAPSAVSPLQRRASSNYPPSSPALTSTFPKRRVSHLHRNRQQAAVHDLKKEIIRLLLSPIFDTFGSISVRKAMDKIPKDSWWPLDHDVRIIVDQEARKDMVAVVMSIRRQKRDTAQRQRRGTGADFVASNISKGKGKGNHENAQENEGGGVAVMGWKEHNRQESREVSLQQLSEQKQKEQKKRRGTGMVNFDRIEAETGKQKTKDRWHKKAIGPFKRMRKWVVERKKKGEKDQHDVEDRNHDMTDRQNRVGSKIGGAGVAGSSESNVDRRERLRKLALETIDLAKDPYFMRNHLGSYECKLCLTLHTNEGSYLAHTQGKKHQTNLGRRAAKDALEKPDPLAPLTAAQQAALKAGTSAAAPTFKRNIIKIGLPGYKVTKIRDPTSRQVGLLFEIAYPEIGQGIEPRYRFMSAYEQQIQAPNKAHQYLVIAAEPYETISFKVQSRDIDRAEEKLWSHWDVDQKMYTMQFFFKNDQRLLSSSRMENAPGYNPNAPVGATAPGTQMANPLNPFHAPMRTAA
ncbi:hypothetical protein FBU30_009869 [Linnemannia zychae]|nr:hypothetical protein FBU30_009869 [Linnemannia zychae]